MSFRRSGWPLLALALLPVWLGACSTDRDLGDLFAPADVGTPVVDAVLIVDAPMPDLFLSRTMNPEEPYAWPAAAERGASVRIQAPETSTLIEYQEVPGAPGRYEPVYGATVQPDTRYELIIATRAGESVRAETTTPARFRVADWVLLDNEGIAVQRRLRTFAELGDGVYQAEENQLVYSQGILEARFDRGEVPAYQFGIFSLDMDSDFVIDPDYFDESDYSKLERAVSSMPQEAADGSMRLPWLAIYFQGRYLVKAFAVDENWFDFARSVPPVDGGIGIGSNLGDNFERPLFHVEGGIGLFGSAAVDSVGFYVHERP